LSLEQLAQIEANRQAALLRRQRKLAQQATVNNAVRAYFNIQSSSLFLIISRPHHHQQQLSSQLALCQSQLPLFILK